MMPCRPRWKRIFSNKAKIGRQTLKKQILRWKRNLLYSSRKHHCPDYKHWNKGRAHEHFGSYILQKQQKYLARCSRVFVRWSRTFAGWLMLPVYLRTLVGWSYFGFSLLKSATTCCIHSLKIHVFFVEIQRNASARKTHQEHQFLCNFSWSLTRNNQNREGARKRMVTEPGRALSVENLFKQRNSGSKQSWQARKLAYEGQMHNEISRGGLER